MADNQKGWKKYFKVADTAGQMSPISGSNQFGLPGTSDPRIEVYKTGTLPLAANDDWSDSLTPVFASVGAFGYQAETIDASLAMGELWLLPAVRKAPDDVLIVADGTSCRQQIKDGANREAMHVARVLAMSLDKQRSTTSANPKE